MHISISVKGIPKGSIDFGSGNDLVFNMRQAIAEPSIVEFSDS